MKNRINTNESAPVRYRYHLSLSRRRGINLSSTTYYCLKSIGLIVDGKVKKKQEGKLAILEQNTFFNIHLRDRCNAIELNIDDQGTKDILITVLKEHQNYVPSNVANALKSLLGIMIKQRALAG